jgi:hypothetical protein
MWIWPGVIRIGAVNCQEEFMLCRRQGIGGYPTLNLYTLGEGTKEFQVLPTDGSCLALVPVFPADGSYLALVQGIANRWLLPLFI